MDNTIELLSLLSRIDPKTPLEFLGFVTGVAGTALLAVQPSKVRVTFMFYAASNICWIAYAALQNAPYLLAMNLSYAVFTAVGLVRTRP